MKPLISRISLTLDEPTPADKRADKERLLSALIKETGITQPVQIDPDILKELPSHLRQKDWHAEVVIGYERDRVKVISLNRTAPLAAAIDIGTTNMVASLIDLSQGRRFVTREKDNPQAAIGLDVLTRIHAAMGGKGETLHQLLIEGINDLLRGLCSDNNIATSDLLALVIAGNTIMTHFLLGLTTEHIPVEPYIPVVHRTDFVDPSAIGLDINRRGVVYIFPNAGSYVGGDIIAGILSTGLYKEKEPSILIDVGTNAEIVLGCDEWIVVGAGAAGPALEGGIAEIGMRATRGAISRVRLLERPARLRDSGGNLEVEVETIGGSEPQGICGSGMIELVAELYAHGIIDKTGRFAGHADRMVRTEGRKAFLLYESGDRRLLIKDTEVDNFLRSKAAMFSALSVIVRAVGLRFSDVKNFCVSGAFGMGIDVDKAISIGMIPRIRKERFIPVGNSSIRGAEMLLADRDLLADIDRICEMITYKEMNTDRDFMREFPAALFIPHTNPEVLER